jgi:nitroreductase
MKRSVFSCALALGILAGVGLAEDLQPIGLPKASVEGGKTLMQALSERRTTREFGDEPLSPQMLSNLLWAAFGVNREKTERGGVGRTAPSAMNRQEVQLYVLLPTGSYRYDAQPQVLVPVASGDLRAKAGPPEAARAAVTIVYVADADASFAAVDSGFIGQNVYLFSAAFGLNTCFRAGDLQGLTVPLKLAGKQRALYTQNVGYPPRK